MNVFKEPKPETFEYGFLTSRTAQILYEYIPGAALDSENRRLLEAAEAFIEQILSGEEFVSGNKAHLSHDSEALQALHYGIDALSTLSKSNVIAKLESSEDLRGELINIKRTMASLRDPRENENISSTRIKEAAGFFDVIARALLDEAREHWRPQFAYR